MERNEKLSFEESSLDELLEAADDIIQDGKNWGNLTCDKCHCSNANFKGYLSTNSCYSKEAFFIALKMSVEKLQKNSSQVGKCSECKNVDLEFLKKSGYHFCKYWHNLTSENGFCYVFESKKIASESVDNLP